MIEVQLPDQTVREKSLRWTTSPSPIEPGQILGLLSRNGAGKSTTMNILTGYLSSTEGPRVLIDGIDILENPIEAKRKKWLSAGVAPHCMWRCR